MEEMCIWECGDAESDDEAVFILSDGGKYPRAMVVESYPLEEPPVFQLYCVALDKCTFANGVLSDNEYHPEYSAWFADSINDVARCVGIEPMDIVEALCSDDPVQRWHGYESLRFYFGLHEFDYDPVEFRGPKDRRFIRRQMRRWHKQAEAVRYAKSVGLSIDTPACITADKYEDKGEVAIANYLRNL